MSILAIIPARSGSKRIKNKNIKILNKKPLIFWTISEARKVKCLDHLLVSTNDSKIADIALKYGAEVPFLRPYKLSTDNSPTIDTVLHALDYYKNINYIIILQPTSPFRKAYHIRKILEFCIKKKIKSAVSISKNSEAKKKAYRLRKDNKLIPQKLDSIKKKNQNDIYRLNGAMYVVSKNWLLKNKTFVNKETFGYVMPKSLSLDIDYDSDWEKAKKIFRKLNAR